MQGTLLVMRGQEAAIELLERAACTQVKLRPAYRHLLSVSGIGRVLGLTILLETGPLERFAAVGNYASYCRCVGSERLSNGKRKGRGNTKRFSHTRGGHDTTNQSVRLLRCTSKLKPPNN